MSGFAVTSYNPAAIGILSARVESLQSSLDTGNANVTLGINSERYQTFLLPCQNIDGFSISSTTTLNATKVSIANSGDGDIYYSAPRTFLTAADATTAVNTDYNGVVTNVGVATALRFGAASTFNSGQFVAQENTGAFGSVIVTATSQRVLLTGVAGTGSFNTTDDCSVGIGTTYVLADSVGVPNQIRFAGFGNINQDSITINAYPNLEPTADTSAASPYTGATVETLTNANRGLGVANTHFSNGGAFIGTVFAFQAGGNPGAATSVSDMIAEVTNLRTGITSFTTTVNLVKPYKISYQVNVWSLTDNDTKNQASIAGLQTAINILNDPAFGGPY